MEQEIRACLDQKLYQKAFDLLLPEYQNKVFSPGIWHAR
jgi:hypothetical protein